jgi:hypothetical protein
MSTTPFTRIKNLPQAFKKMKIFIIAICIIGVSGVCYGMLRDHDSVFIAGIALITAGYIMIRKRLKEKIGNRE